MRGNIKQETKIRRKPGRGHPVFEIIGMDLGDIADAIDRYTDKQEARKVNNAKIDINKRIKLKKVAQKDTMFHT